MDGRDRTVAFGHREWVKGKASFEAYLDEPAAACAAWLKEDTFVLKQCFTETPFIVSMTLRFSGAEATFAAETNVGFGGTRKAPLTGKVQ